MKLEKLEDTQSLINAKIDFINFFESCEDDMLLNHEVLKYQLSLMDYRESISHDKEKSDRIDSLLKFVEAFDCLANV